MAVYEGRRWWATALLALGLSLATTTVAERREAPPLDRLASGGSARVVEAIDGDTVVLADGRQVRLVGIQAPKLPLGRADFPAWPLAPEAKTRLESLALGRPVSLLHGGRRTDRHGRVLAHLRREDGLWLQGEMLRSGLARVYTFADNRALAAEMLALEGEARAARRGLWGHPFYAIRRHDALSGVVDSFQLVEAACCRSAKPAVAPSSISAPTGEPISPPGWRQAIVSCSAARASTIVRSRVLWSGCAAGWNGATDRKCT
ncbi:MAG: hypothetical protein FJX68_05995 [Alphaproteobacteria bacterium]|nr:hypothetical protein [Alphaproteobacteria bacterium]